MPTIGPHTVSAAHDAGLAGIGVEAGRSLILDYEAVLSPWPTRWAFSSSACQEDGT